MNNVMAKIRFGVPPFAEQRRIADFLDAETAKLDTLVAKRRELIEKLKEKRSALISRTVTRGLPPEAARAAGLNPNPKLKPSGIEWLGEIPEHWEVVQLFRLTATIQTGPFGSQLHQSDYVDEGVPLINPSHLIDSRIVPDDQETQKDLLATVY
jgi:type I restriction enzyme S subunit